MSTAFFEREESAEAWNGSEETDSSQGTLIVEDTYQSQTILASNSGYEVGQGNQDQNEGARGVGYQSEINSSAGYQQEGVARYPPALAGVPGPNYSMARFCGENLPFSQFTVEGITTRAPTLADDAQAPDILDSADDQSPDEKPGASNKHDGKNSVRHKSGGKEKHKEADKKKGSGKEKSNRKKRTGKERKKAHN